MREFLEYQSNTSAFKAPVEAVLSMFYSVNDLWEPVRDILYPALGLPAPEKRPKKSVLSKQLLDTFNNPARLKAFLEATPKKTLEVWQSLVWGNVLLLEAFEEQLGFEISEILDHRYAGRIPRRRREFPFVVLINTRGFYRHADDENPRKHIAAAMPPKLRDVFKKCMPKPKGYYIETAEEPPRAQFSFRNDTEAPEDMRFLAEYIESGNLQVTKSNKIRMACLRTIASVMGGGEFFEDIEDSATLPMLRTRMLASFMNGPARKAIPYILDPPQEYPGKPFRALLAAAFIDPSWLHEHFLGHVKGRPQYDRSQLEDLFKLFSNLNIDGWTTAQNLASYSDFRDLDFDIFRYDDLAVSVIDRSRKDWDFYGLDQESLDEDFRNFVTLPMIHGMAFLLAALGFVEIRYNHPASVKSRWKRSKEDFLSPFCGLAAIRLTSLGAFALVKTQEFELPAPERKSAHVVLNEHRLTLTCRDLDRATEVLLNDYTEKISEGFYRMTRHSLIRGCKTDRDVAMRIERFKKRIPSDIPPIWEQFFTKTAENCVALRRRFGYVFYDLSDTPELRRLFLSDPLLRKKSIKTAGPGVAVHQKDISEVSRRLAALGYLMDQNE